MEERIYDVLEVLCEIRNELSNIKEELSDIKYEVSTIKGISGFTSDLNDIYQKLEEIERKDIY